MASETRGVALAFWKRIDRELFDRKMSQKELAELSGVSAMTINRLRTQPNPPKPETIHALADVFGIPHDEAAVLAGRFPADDDVAIEEQISVRDAIRRSPAYTAAQRKVLLAMVDLLDEQNAARRTAPDAPRSAEAG